MSSEALSWAFKQDIKPSSVKFTLVALCECANYRTGRITPSIAHLCEITGQDRKTIIANIAELERRELIRDTGERTGTTKQIKVYQAAIEAGAQAHRQEAHYVYRLTNPLTGEFYIGVRSFLGDPIKDSYRGSGRWPTGAAYRGIDLHREVLAQFTTRSEAERVEANMIAEAIGLPLCRNLKEESHKRDTIPKTGSLNSTVFPPKQSQKRDTEPSLEPSNKHTEQRGRLIPDDWRPEEFGSGSKSAAIVASWDREERETNIEHFIAHHQAKRTMATDWQPWWKTWVLNSKKFRGSNERPNQNLRQANGGSHDRRSSLARACDEALDFLG